jgi:hypothetical protein
VARFSLRYNPAPKESLTAGTEKTPSAIEPLLDQPAPTRIVALLVARGKATLTELQLTLGVTKGILAARLKNIAETTLCKHTRKAVMVARRPCKLHGRGPNHVSPDLGIPAAGAGPRHIQLGRA